MRLDAELRVLLEAKESFLLDLKLDMYRYIDANAKLEQKLKHADLQMVESMKQIKSLSAEVEDLKEIRNAAVKFIDLVDPGERKSLLQPLQEAPHNFQRI